MNESKLVPREEMSDLDWLARNVHVWPESTPHIIPVGDCVFEFGATFFESHVCLYHSEPADSKVIHKHQWLALRAELQNKPSWKDAPEWGCCMVQDKRGNWYFCSDTPSSKDSEWDDDSIRSSVLANGGVVIGDWRDTLEKRPEQPEFEPFVSVEDAATAKQPSPKGSGNTILGMVLADLTNRALEGKEKYGEPLLAYNGRNPLWDAYQEALDLAMYLRQAIEEQK